MAKTTFATPKHRLSLQLLPILLCLTSIAWSEAAQTQADCGSPAVEVTEKEGAWLIRRARTRVELNPATLQMTIQAGDSTWSTVASSGGDLLVENSGKSLALCLADAGRRTVSAYRTGFKTGVKVSLGDFRQEGTRIDVGIDLFICLEGADQELVCELIAREKGAQVLECAWPPAPSENSFDATVVPFMQGMLLPKSWPKQVYLYDTMSYGRGLYMPWWGHQKGRAAMLVLIETPEDAGCRFEHPAGGPTRMQLRWVHSLGELRYPRRVRLCFFDKGNYVTLAKRYRRSVQETGHFVSLREKIARSPLVGKLIGSPVIHTSILYHIQPESQYYSKDNPAQNHQLATFDERAEQLCQLAAKGVDRAYIHLDGWGFRGYDNLHPDILPPSPDAGGWEAMRRLADACDKLGFVFAIHDQYRDYYVDAKSYDPNHTILDREGQRPFHSIWYGGKQTLLCSRLAPGHVRKNYTWLLDHGIKVRGAYLDVFAVVPPDECYHPDHPATRADCLRYRGMCMDFIRSTGGVVSSEEPADWAIPHIDLVHHGPFALHPGPGSGPAMGIPIPLFNLVYHDALLLPWSMGKGGWGIPETDLGYLHGLANAGMPYLSLSPSGEELEQVHTLCALNQRVGLLEMTNHEFLDDSFRRQRTSFADGTTVTIDLEKDTFEIAPKLPATGENRMMKYTPRSAGDATRWQKELRTKLAARLKIDDLIQERAGIPLNPQKLSSLAKGAYAVEEFEISATKGRRMRIIVTTPTSQDGPRPAVVCIGGHGSDLYSPYGAGTVAKNPEKTKADDFHYRGFATALAERGYVTISTTVSQHDVREEDRLLMGERLWDLMRCVDTLRSLPQVDASRIGCAGLSLGGEMAMWLGAMDERIAATVSAGFLTTMDHMEQNHCLCWKFDGLRELADFADIYSLTAPRALQCQNGLLEPESQFYVPLAREAMKEVRAIYDDTGKPENIALDVHDEGHVVDLPALLCFLDKHLRGSRPAGAAATN